LIIVNKTWLWKIAVLPYFECGSQWVPPQWLSHVSGATDFWEPFTNVRYIRGQLYARLSTDSLPDSLKFSRTESSSRRSSAYFSTELSGVTLSYLHLSSLFFCCKNETWCRAALGWRPEAIASLPHCLTGTIDVENDFYVFFILITFCTFFNVLFILQTFFDLKNVGKVQSGKQINKKHFQNNSNEIETYDLCVE